MGAAVSRSFGAGGAYGASQSSVRALALAAGAGLSVGALLLLRARVPALGARAVPTADREAAAGEAATERCQSGDTSDAPARPEALAPGSAEQDTRDAHSIKSRVENFKKSKLRALVESIGSDLGMSYTFNMADGSATREEKESVTDTATATPSDEQDDTSSREPTTEQEQVAMEEKTFTEALRLLHIVRRSRIPKLLPHFHTLNLQLQNLDMQLGEVIENVDSFWRYGREEPMAEVLALPFMRLARFDGNDAIVPLPLEEEDKEPNRAAQHDADGGDAPEGVLRAGADASREEIESAFRHQARELYKNGECVDRETYQRLHDEYEIRVMTHASQGRVKCKGSDDVLAHYFLVGTDPKQSRYREYTSGILDAAHLTKLINKLQFLRDWGETSGSATGLGQG